MPNSFNSETGQAAKKGGGSGVMPKAGVAPNKSTPMKAGPFPGVPGKTGPKRDTMGVRKANIYANSEGL